MSNKSVKQFDGSKPAKSRRRTVAVRLEEQLRDGVKIRKGATADQVIDGTAYTPLEEKDRKRITKELETIKSRI